MVDTISKAKRSENMRAVKSKNTAPEQALRRILHARGYRYRLHGKDLPGKPDLVFPIRKKVIFVHGCFWHRHLSKTCRRSNLPKSNQSYWVPKLRGNQIRDKQHRRTLANLGWKSFVIWECEVKDEAKVLKRATSFLGPPGSISG